MEGKATSTDLSTSAVGVAYDVQTAEQGDLAGAEVILTLGAGALIRHGLNVYYIADEEIVGAEAVADTGPAQPPVSVSASPS